MEGLVSEWFHLEWKNQSSDELPQADVVLAALLQRLLLWATPCLHPCVFSRYTEVGMAFVPGIAAFSSLFKKIHTLRVCMHTVTLPPDKVV